LFDLDDTLYDHSFAAHSALDGIRLRSEDLRRVPRARLWARYDAILEELHPLVLSGRLDPVDARRERFRRLFASFEDPRKRPPLDSRVRQYRSLYLEHQRAVPGAVALVRRIAEEAKVVVVSNNLEEEQSTKLSAVGLAPYVDLLVTSETAGVAKPHPGIFRQALSGAGLGRSPVVVVGDSWSADVVGARAAGLPVIWFNRLGRVAPEVGAVPELSSLRPTGRVVAAIRAHAATRPRRRSK
jgi:HAD superfamily hydrolase (TIGR01549 family)